MHLDMISHFKVLDNTMASSSFFYLRTTSLLLLFSLRFLVNVYAAGGGNFNNNFDITWGGGRGKIIGAGNILTLSLDNVSGSGFQSKKEYHFGRIDMQLKLVPGNSAGTVTAYYVSRCFARIFMIYDYIHKKYNHIKKTIFDLAYHMLYVCLLHPLGF